MKRAMKLLGFFAMVALAKFFDWPGALVIVKPETFIRWHRTAFRTFWRWRSRKRGRPAVPKNIRELIHQIRPKIWNLRIVSLGVRGVDDDILSANDRIPKRARQANQQPRNLPYSIHDATRPHEIEHTALLQSFLKLLSDGIDVDPGFRRFHPA